MKNFNKINFLFSTILLSSCSPVVNTISGITTFQSTISGSNYPFSVDPKNGRLKTIYNEINAEKLIGKHDSFEITLDSLFLRYLQASDPYVMIYSEAWMGPEIMPLDKKKLQRQIVLIKDGLSFNALQPITSIPLLGPVTMGDDSLDVHVSVHVVVLSKSDNQQTIDYLNGVSAVASTAAPQYALIAGAAADIGKAIVNQNRDKVEFEHTFNLTPINSVNGIFKSRHGTGPNLEEGKLVVIKGENEHRLVPYQNWYFYVSPFNWYGHPPEQSSVRFEDGASDLKPGFWNITFDEEANYTLINLPFGILDFIFIPNNSNVAKFIKKPPIEPGNLSVCGNYLLEIKPTSEEQYSIDKICDIKLITDSDNSSLNNFTDRFYHDKTFAILSIKRTDGSHGSFSDLYSSFEKAGYGNKIDELNTTYEEYLNQSSASIKQAAESTQTAIEFERAKKQAYKLANEPLYSNKTIDGIISEKSKITNPEDKEKLQILYWEELAIQSAKRLKSKVDNVVDAIIKQDSTPNIEKFCEKLDSIISYEQNYWRKPSIKSNNTEASVKHQKDDQETSNERILDSRNIAWSSILFGLSNYLNGKDHTKHYAPIIINNFEKLKVNDNAIPNSPLSICSTELNNSDTTPTSNIN